MLRKDNNDLKAKIKVLNEKLNSPTDEVIKLEKDISKLKVINNRFFVIFLFYF
jgi:hypothetical protein